MAYLAHRKTVRCHVDGRGRPVIVGDQGSVQVPSPTTIHSWTVQIEPSGSAEFDLLVGGPLDSPSSIVGDVPPAITGGDSDSGYDMTNWTVLIDQDDMLHFQLVSVSDLTESVTLFLHTSVSPLRS